MADARLRIETDTGVRRISDAVPMTAPTPAADNVSWTADHVCGVCGSRSAVLDMTTGIFQPCWICQRAGWRLRQRVWWKRRR